MKNLVSVKKNTKKQKNPYSKLQPKFKHPITEIILIRHCNPDYSLQKKLGDRMMPLSRYGLKQRKLLTERMLTMQIHKVYTSSIKRAKETAASYLKIKKKRAIIEEGLDEINWKDWHNVKYFNMSEESRRQRFKDYKDLDKKLDKFQAEVRRVLAGIYRDNVGKKVALVCHGNLIRSIFSGVLNADIIGFLSLEIAQSSISRIAVDKEGSIKVVSINDVNHLPKTHQKALLYGHHSE